LAWNLIPGAEISADFQAQDDVHILALFVDEKNDRFNFRLEERQQNRRRRGELMAEKLIEAGYPLDLDAIRHDVGDGVWGRPHLARALVLAGHAASNDDAFSRFLGREHPWYVHSTKWPALDVLEAIREAGGGSSLAHAVWYKDAPGLIRALAAAGLDALEVFHPDHGPEQEARFGGLAREESLLVTAGSDFHGTPEGRKHPGGVVGTAEMLGLLRARARSR
jgi:predicted metal-dependent phosphoesterase TrpH